MCYLDNLPSEEIVDDDPAGRTARVDEALAGGVSGREVAPDQSLEDGVASVGHHTGVSLHPGPLSHHGPGNSLPPVVPLLVAHHHPAPLHGSLAGEPPDVPELDALVLAVTDEVAAVSPRVNVSDPIRVTGQDSHWLGVVFPESSPVPDHADPVISARHQDVGCLVHEGDSVHVVVVSRDPTGLLVGFSVINIETAVIGSTQQLPGAAVS